VPQGCGDCNEDQRYDERCERPGPPRLVRLRRVLRLVELEIVEVDHPHTVQRADRRELSDRHATSIGH
ncbi:MAG: hypothetical protein LC753_14380, partial [Acidobacteria bacterium]|nr:hypothetical protein [Acidobacteriota bacterium]